MTGSSFSKLSIKAVDLVWPETVTNHSAPLFRLYSTQERAGVLDKEFESISMKILIKYLQHRRCQNSHDPQSWNIYKNKEVLGLELFLASSLYVRPATIKIRRSSLLVLVVKVLDFQTDTQTKSFGVQIHHAISLNFLHQLFIVREAQWITRKSFWRGIQIHGRLLIL